MQVRHHLRNFSLLLIIFSLYNTFCDLFFELLGIEIMGLNPVTAWGGMQGFNIVNFGLMYVLGAYLRNNPIEIKKSKIILLLIISVSLITIWAEFNNIFPSTRMRSAWVHHNPIVILYALLLFILFNKIKIKSNIINTSAKSVYTCFLAHCHIIMLVSIPVYVQKTLSEMLLHYLIFTILSYIIFWLCWFLYDLITQRIYKELDKYEICYFLV